MARKAKKFFILFFILIITALSALCGCGTDLNADDLMSTRDKIRLFNVNIDAYYYLLNSPSGTPSVGGSHGSGVIFYEDDYRYYALTNHHVITDTPESIGSSSGTRFRVTYSASDVNGYSYSATLLKKDESRDMAIISFTKNADSLLRKANYTARLNNNIKENEFVLAVGNPGGVNNVVTFGEVLGHAHIQNVDFQVIAHNALLNAGNSGGALCDISGNLIGLNTWGTEDRDDMNYAIPMSVVNQFIDEFFAEQQ